MTGLLPDRTGAHDNFTRLSPRFDDTLALVLKRAGYRTGGFVGALVLASTSGLDRGFDVYDDTMDAASHGVRRNAEAVCSAAFKWITGSRESLQESPWFAWIHLYDVHDPQLIGANRKLSDTFSTYASAVSYVDLALGRLLSRLDQGGFLEHTVIIVTADHGESLGEHGEHTHGLFAYDATLRVPFVIWAPAMLPARVISGALRMIDVTPTVLEAVGAPPLPESDGHSVYASLVGRVPLSQVPVRFEAATGHLAYGWAPLKGVVYGRWKLIELPIPELYDLSEDPRELNNLYDANLDKVSRLKSFLVLAAGSTRWSETRIAPDVEERLASLGYTNSAQQFDSERAGSTDPKTVASLYANVDDAVDEYRHGNILEALERLERLSIDQPGFTLSRSKQAWMAHDLEVLGDVRLDRVARLSARGDPARVKAVALLLARQGSLKVAEKFLVAVVRHSPQDIEAFDALIDVYIRMGDYPKAVTLLVTAVRRHYPARAIATRKARIYLASGKLLEARRILSTATRTAISARDREVEGLLAVAAARADRESKTGAVHVTR